jgi:hypothetical protein
MEKTTPLFLIFLTLMILKLCHVISWSWWLVTLPLWGGYAIFLAALILVFGPELYKSTIAAIKRWRK